MKSTNIELVILAISLIITAIIGWSQIRLGTIQAQLSAHQAYSDSINNVDNIELQLMNFSKEFLLDIKKPGKEGDLAEDVVVATVEHLTNELKRNTLAKIVDRINKEHGLKTDAKNVDAFRVRIEEATISPESDEEWFAVIASFGLGQEDLANSYLLNAQSKLSNEGTDYKIRLWKTKISRNIAVTIDAKLSKEEASERVKYARQTGLSEDAFIQINRNWVIY